MKLVEEFLNSHWLNIKHRIKEMGIPLFYWLRYRFHLICIFILIIALLLYIRGYKFDGSYLAMLHLSMFDGLPGNCSLEGKNFFADLIGIYFALVIGHYQIAETMRRMWIALTETESNPVSVFESAMIGCVERIFYVFILYLMSLQANAALAIGFWLALKTAGQWRIWPEEHIEPGVYTDSLNRSAYQIFLIGNALSIGYAFVGWLIISWLRFDNFLEPLSTIILVLVGNNLLKWIITLWGEEHYTDKEPFRQQNKDNETMQGLEVTQADGTIVEHFSRLVESYNNKGISLKIRGKKLEAFKCFKKAADAWNKKGKALDALKKYDEAIEAFDEAIKLDPNYADAWYNKGDALEVLGRTAEADAAFAKAKELRYRG